MYHQQETNRMHNPSTCPNRRTFLATGAIGAATVTSHRASTPLVAADLPSPIVVPPAGKRILISCKLGMIAKEESGKKLTLVERLKLAASLGQSILFENVWNQMHYDHDAHPSRLRNVLSNLSTALTARG